MSIPRLPGLIWGLVIAVCLRDAAIAAGPVPVEGDRELLSFLRDSLIMNEARFTKGKLTATVFSMDDDRIFWDSSGTIMWDGDKTYWDLLCREDDRPKGVVESIALPGVTLYWNRGETRLVRMHGTLARPTYGWLWMRPDSSWYLSEPFTDTRLHEYLDASGSTPLSGHFRKIVVTRAADDDDIVIVNVHIDTGVAVEYKFSLAMSGNPLHFLNKRDGDCPYFEDRECSYDWLPDGRGGWRLKSMIYTCSGPPFGNSRGYKRSVEIQVDSFEPDAEIPADRFTEESFHCPLGTEVNDRWEDASKSRVYYLGGRVEEDLDVKLNRVSASIKEKGFAGRK